MIGSLRGTLTMKGLEGLLVEVGGVGYLVQISAQTLAALPPEGAEATLRCHTHVREDAIQIFGFSRAEELQLFELLLSVSGIGPKLALTMLSGMTVEDLVAAISAADHKRIQATPGVGRKTAERVVVDLKDKVARVFAAAAMSVAAPPVAAADEQEGVVEALVNMGFKRPAADKMVRRVADQQGEGVGREALLRLSLAALMER